MFKYPLYLSFLLLFVCCQHPGTVIQNNSMQGRDTVIYNTHYTFFGQDSIHTNPGVNQHKTIYIHPEPLDKVHYMLHDTLNRLIEIGWTRDTVIFDSGFPEIFHLSDEFIQYDEKNTIFRKGYLGYENEESFLHGRPIWESFEEFNPEGIVTTRWRGTINCREYTEETFYPDGKPKESYTMEFGRQMLSTYKRWTPEGWLEEVAECDELYPDGNFSSGLFIHTTRLYYPNGKIKQISHKKQSENLICTVLVVNGLVIMNRDR